MEGGVSSGGATAAPLNVLVAIDDSDESFHALRWALDNILKQKSETDQNSTVVTIAQWWKLQAKYKRKMLQESFPVHLKCVGTVC
ncbi:hypothetical protein ACS0TY_015724 [Phlomoides rotata]